MKKIINFAIIATVILCVASCGDDMFDTAKKFAVKEKVYPAMFDTIYGNIGFERVELDLLKQGRIPASEINMGKSKKTIVEYDGNELVIDTLCSWIPIDGLTMPKLYRFKVYTIDEYENKSVPQEIALIPYTGSDLAALTIAQPRIIASPWTATLIWSSPSSVLLDYYGLTYSYKDKDGNIIEGEREENPQIAVGNLEAGTNAKVDVKYKIVPRLNDVPILDTLYVDQPVNLFMPTSEIYQKELKVRGIESMSYSESLEIRINWLAVDDFTMMHTTLKYTDTSNEANPVEKTLIIDNDEMETIVSGLKIGTPFYISSNYKPEGVEDVYIDSDAKTYDPDGLDYQRSSWTVASLHQHASDGNAPSSIIDGNISTFMSLAKPGRSVNGSVVPANELTGFTIDLKQQIGLDYLRIKHRNSTVGLRIWGVTLHGSHDGSNWQIIAEDLSIPDATNGNVVDSPNVLFPRSYFRYFRVYYSNWDPVNNGAIQLSEFYLGASKTPIIQ